MADNVQGTSPSHKANRFVELLMEAENIARDIEPEVELLVAPRYKPYIAVAQGLMAGFDAIDGPTVADAVEVTSGSPQAVIESHGALQNELLARAPLPDPPATEMADHNITGTQKP